MKIYTPIRLLKSGIITLVLSLVVLGGLACTTATLIQLDDEQLVLQDLPHGQQAEIKSNPITKVAIRVQVKD